MATLFERHGIKLEEINPHCLTDGKQLLGVDAGLCKYFLYCAGMDIYAVGQPLIGVALTTKLIPDYLSYIYLHKKTASSIVCTRGSGLPIPQTKKLAITRERLASTLRYSQYEIVQIPSATSKANTLYLFYFIISTLTYYIINQLLMLIHILAFQIQRYTFSCYHQAFNCGKITSPQEARCRQWGRCPTLSSWPPGIPAG